MAALPSTVVSLCGLLGSRNRQPTAHLAVFIHAFKRRRCRAFEVWVQAYLVHMIDKSQWKTVDVVIQAISNTLLSFLIWKYFHFWKLLNVNSRWKSSSFGLKEHFNFMWTELKRPLNDSSGWAHIVIVVQIWNWITIKGTIEGIKLIWALIHVVCVLGSSRLRTHCAHINLELRFFHISRT